MSFNPPQKKKKNPKPWEFRSPEFNFSNDLAHLVILIPVTLENHEKMLWTPKILCITKNILVLNNFYLYIFKFGPKEMVKRRLLLNDCNHFV